jgi:tetratricopeptide (TPR) repeat protein
VEHVLVALEVPEGAVPDTLTRLVDRSLLSVDSSDDGSVRYRLLDSIRTFAADRLRDAGLAETAHRAHAGWYAQTADWCEAHVRGTDQPACLALARSERANVDAALDWSRTHDRDLGARIASGFGWTWVVLGDDTAAATRIRRSLSSATSPAAQASALALAGWLEASAGDVALAQQDLDEADRIAGLLDGPLLRADVARNRAFVYLQQGLPAEASSCAAASLATYRTSNLPWETAVSLVLAAYGALMLGDTASAARDGAEAVSILTPIGDSWGLVHAKAMLGGIAQAEHRFEDAIDALSGAAEESMALGFLGQAGLHLGSLARAQQRAGAPAQAAASFERSLAAATASGDGRMAATARLNLARLLRSTGDAPAAVALLRKNLEWYAGAGGGDGALLSRCVLAAVTDDRTALQEVLTLARVEENQVVTILALDGLARLHAGEGQTVRATTLVAEADALHPTVAHLLDDADRLDRASAVSAPSALTTTVQP